MANTTDDNAVRVVDPASRNRHDIRRAHEFYRYLQPDNLVQPHLRRRSSTFDVNHDHIPSLTNALVPYCQLTAIRCNAAKAMLNVMDRDIMYFLAEASLKRTNVGGEDVHTFVEDPIFLECSSAPLKGRICEMTLALDKPDDRCQVPTFVIPDLSKSQFAHMNIVTGPPYYRFYAGVPITTRLGVNIGSIAIMDTAPRPDGLTASEREYLGRTAEQIMMYLETNRQAIEGIRSRKMAQGLEAFIAGQRSIGEDGVNAMSEKIRKRRARAAYGIGSDPDRISLLKKKEPLGSRNSFKMNARSNSLVSLESEMSDSDHSSDSGSEEEKVIEGDAVSHATTLSRAANLLRECLGDLGVDGSVHFLGLATRLSSSASKVHVVNGSAANLPRVPSLADFTKPASDEESHHKQKSSHVIASSTASNPSGRDVDTTHSDLDLDDDLLRQFMRRYPGGQCWTLDDTSASSSEDDSKLNGHNRRAPERSRRSSRRKHSELLALRSAFPNARQVLFAPVWDASIGSFAFGCFVTTALETRPFTSSTELPFLNSFCSMVMAECSRLDTMMADRQKSDFVGTISHEMRSPLHGVLASVEFLADTEVTSFQRSLVETIDSCGRTLLDTINHVLDFSKVNSFQKQWQAANKRGTHGARRNYLGPDNSSKAAATGAPPLLQLFGMTDVSAVLEEVVDGLVLGNTYNSGIDITDTSKEARGRPSGKPTSLRVDDVEIVLNVQHGDWTFMTQPGAVRRIIMNITGNAIKYTTHGRIDVQLTQKDSSEDSSNTRIMVFTVTDTGKGISPEFLASRLFVPFAQENALAPGTGLGMSIVRSIVLMLGGTIDVKSRVGKGTTVEVALPMKKPLPGQLSTQNTPHSGGTGVSGNSAGDESITLLQNQASDEVVAFYRQRPRPDDPLVKAVQHYVQDWYGIECVDQRLLEASSVVIVEEEDLDHLMVKAVSTPGKRPALVIMCSVSSRHSTSRITSLEERLSSPVEFVARPCGPNKLARSIRSALEKKRALKPRFPQVTNLGVIPESMTPNGGLTPMPSTARDPAGNELKELDLSSPGERGPVVQATERFAASQISQNAQMAIHDPSAGLRTPRTQMSDSDAFPFPVQPAEKSRQRRDTVRSRGVSVSEQSTLAPPPSTNANVVTATATQLGTAATTDSLVVDPHVLLVDDNKINLKLLETFLQKKRHYSRISKAEDGRQAVDAVMGAKEPYDIIFMDISMPVMNGFEATRAIRDYEEQFAIHPGAMVIALTGLASGRDQSEGFDSGCDIYMTKPVSFKEVGRLLDNWEGHQKVYHDQDLNEVSLRLTSALNVGNSVSVDVNPASVG